MSSQTLAQIRLARVEDASGLVQLFVELAEGRPNARPADDVTAAEVLAVIVKQPDRWLLVAELDDGQIVGTIDVLLVRNVTYGARPWAIVENVGVSKSHQRQGIGSALMQEAVRRAKDANCYKLQLLTAKSNERAQHFYRALGLGPISEGFKIYF